jgi:thiol:disulfide interchange protein DsbC
MKPIEIFFVFFLTGFLITPCIASGISEEAEQSIRAMFGETEEVQIKQYQGQLLEITMGPKTYFASLDGQYLFAGPVLDTETGVDLVELKGQEYRQRRLSQLAPEMYLSFPATTNERHVITVFTDIDCTYCRQLHLSMPSYNELGITVNYVMLPRAGLNSASFHKAVSVFCSSKPAENMTLAMQGKFDQENSCEHTITHQFNLAMEFGINATPTMIYPDGQIKSGFLTPTALQAALDSGMK